MMLWLTAMSCYHAVEGKPEQFTCKEEQKFLVADNLFWGVVISTLHKKYVDSYNICTSAKKSWDILEAKFGVSEAGSELYLLE